MEWADHSFRHQWLFRSEKIWGLLRNGSLVILMTYYFSGLHQQQYTSDPNLSCQHQWEPPISSNKWTQPLGSSHHSTLTHTQTILLWCLTSLERQSTSQLSSVWDNSRLVVIVTKTIEEFYAKLFCCLEDSIICGIHDVLCTWKHFDPSVYQPGCVIKEAWKWLSQQKLNLDCFPR